MAQIVETTQVYLNEKRQGLVTCVHCGVKHPINMSNYTDHNLGGKALKVKCATCKKVFHVKFDLRKYHRINVNIIGKMSYMNTKEERNDINIVSLSVGGVGFIMDDGFYVKDGDIFEIKFQLDDDANSVVCEEITVKHVNGHFVGAEFYHNDKYNYELDFYIMSEPLYA